MNKETLDWIEANATARDAKAIRAIFDRKFPPMKKTTEVSAVFEHYKIRHKRSKLSPKQQKLIKDRLADGYTVSDLRQAIDGLHNSPFHNGDNEAGRNYLRIGLAMDPDKIAGFIELGEDKQKTRKPAQINRREAVRCDLFAESRTWSERTESEIEDEINYRLQPST